MDGTLLIRATGVSDGQQQQEEMLVMTAMLCGAMRVFPTHCEHSGVSDVLMAAHHNINGRTTNINM